MKISVIIRCYNSAGTVERAVRSVLEQDFPKNDFEVVVIDDGSTDATPEKLEYFGSRIAVHRGGHQGHIGAAILGLEKARGDYFIFVDADDFCEPEFLKELCAALSGNPRAAFAYCDYNKIAPDGLKKTVSIDGRIFNLIASNCLFRRSVADEEGFWEKDLLLPEYSLAIRLLARHEAVWVRRALYNYCRNGASVSAQEGFTAEAFAQLVKKFGLIDRPGGLKSLRMDECADLRRDP